MVFQRFYISALSVIFMIMAVTNARAELIEFTPTETGSIIISSFDATHTQPLTSIRGWQAAMANYVNYSSYLVFDLTALTFTPRHATLLLNVDDSLFDLAGPGALTTWGLDAFTPADLMALPTGDLSGQSSLASDIASDLRGGTSLADDVLGADGLVRIDLNNSALAQITATNGWWGLGLNDSRFGALLGGLDLLSSPRLILSDESNPPGPIPVPATPALILIALALLAARRHLARR